MEMINIQLNQMKMAEMQKLSKMKMVELQKLK